MDAPGPGGCADVVPSPSMVDEQLSPLELAMGMVLGPQPGAEPLPAPTHSISPRAALEHEIVEALQRPPCIVMFSGGRDSSAILAVATAVARREGLAPPIPLTHRYPSVPSTHEDDWQEQVIRHIGTEEWIRVDIDEEMDWIGPTAARVLPHTGVLWPPNAFSILSGVDHAEDGTVLTGLFGDELLGRDAGAVHLRQALRGRARPTGQDVKRVLLASAPRPIAAALLKRTSRVIDTVPDWLRPEPRQRAIEALARHAAADPVRWPPSLELWWRGRYRHVAQEAFQAVGRTESVDIRHPFGAEAFVTALRHDEKSASATSRSETMQWLFSDLLPPAVLVRRSKAHFHAVYWNTATKAFIAQWNGSGVDSSLVDPAILAGHWRRNAAADRPTTRFQFQSVPLLQAAWLASRRWPNDQ